jgi:Phosphotransferase system, mannose/fructose/N-acetylgalactosamine-specific component IIC
MNAGLIFAICVAYWLLNALEPWLSYPMINQPLILCAVTGLILGDFDEGMKIGATLQLVFLGVMGIGGTLPQDSGLGSVIGTAFAISLNQSAEVALAFAVPVSVAGSFINLVVNICKGLTNTLVEKWCREGNTKTLEWFHRFLAFGAGIPKAVILFATLQVGTVFAEDLLAAVPQKVIDGLSYASGLMPAVGIALLLRLMWSNKMAVYFFMGVVLVSFFKLDMLGVATVGVVIAVMMIVEGTGARKAGASTDEEELFND